jgi:YesN/AraC family two-component response regulator
MILEDKVSLSEIVYVLGYSSVQYVSNQFKKVSGFTVSQFKSLENPERTPLEDLLGHH